MFVLRFCTSQTDEHSRQHRKHHCLNEADQALQAHHKDAHDDAQGWHRQLDSHGLTGNKEYNAGDDFPHQILNKPILGGKDTCCSETYILIGPFDKKDESINVKTYIHTKFFRFLVLLKKNTQHATKTVYEYVPVQDFSKPWTDEELYAKYGLTEEEIAFIESMIRPME